MAFCAPGYDRGITGCLQRDSLLRIVKVYNQRHNDNPIVVSSSASDVDLWDKIRDGLSNVCGTSKDCDLCWLEQDYIKNDSLISQYYKPPKPVGEKQWLKTSDINKVLKQFEHTNSDFAFMGTVPIDFDQIFEEFAKIDLCSLYDQKGMHLSTTDEHIYKGKAIRQFGFVFNLDRHNQSGSHWVCMFLNYKHKYPYIGYFDSFGVCPPPKEVTNLMVRLAKQSEKCIDIKLRLKSNSIQHQYENSECGMYCIYFIYSCLQGKSFEEITNTKIDDKTVNKLRNFFFRPVYTSRNH